MDYSIISTEELANLYFAASELDPDGESDAMRAMKAEAALETFKALREHEAPLPVTPPGE